MKKRKKSNFKNSNSYILIAALLISLLACFIVNYNKEKQSKAIFKEFTGEINQANSSAIMLMNFSNNSNIAISPVAINSSIGLLYSATDNNSHKEIERYLKSNQNIDEINKILINKYNYISKEKTSLDEYFEKLTEEFNNKYPNISLDTISKMNSTNKSELILLIKKIKLTIKGELTPKEIDKYKLNKDELKQTDQTTIDEIVEIREYYEKRTYQPKTVLYNKIYYDSDTIKKINDSYKKNIKENYNMDLTPISFAEDSTIQEINNNTSLITDNKVNQIIKNTDLIDQNIIVENTLYFSNNWTSAIAPSSQKEDYFGEKLVTMMSSQEIYLSNDKAEGFKKDFNDNYSFIAFNLKTDVKLNEINLEQLISSASEKQLVNVTFPSFKYVSVNNLKGYYTNNGINEIFTPEANFSSLSENQIILKDIYQKIYIEIGDNGTLSTSNQLKNIQTSIKDESLKELVFNKPFYFLIIDNENNNILIIGHLVEP